MEAIQRMLRIPRFQGMQKSRKCKNANIAKKAKIEKIRRK